MSRKFLKEAESAKALLFCCNSSIGNIQFLRMIFTQSSVWKVTPLIFGALFNRIGNEHIYGKLIPLRSTVRNIAPTAEKHAASFSVEDAFLQLGEGVNRSGQILFKKIPY